MSSYDRQGEQDGIAKELNGLASRHNIPQRGGVGWAGWWVGVGTRPPSKILKPPAVVADAVLVVEMIGLPCL